MARHTENKCEILEDQQEDRKLDFLTIKPSSALSYQANTVKGIKSDNMDVINASPNMSDYFMSSIHREADKRASWVSAKDSQCLELYFSEMKCFEGMFRLQVNENG